MLSTIVSLVFSKLGGILAAGLAVLGFWLNLKWQKRKRAQAEAKADGLEAKVEHQEAVAQIDATTQKAEEKIHEAVQGNDGLVDYFKSGKLFRDDSKGGGA